MKKAHAMAALLLAAALTFGSLSIVMADDVTAADTMAVATTTAATTTAATATVATATVATTTTAATVTAPAVQYADLSVTAANYYNLRYAQVGTYPVIEGYADLNAEILTNVDTAYALATDKTFTDTDNVFSVGYTVTDKGQFAQIDVTYSYQLTAGSMVPYTSTDTYYVDKELGKEVTADAYNAGIAVVTPEAAAEPSSTTTTAAVSADQNANDIQMVPIRDNAVSLGYSLAWDDSTKTVILTKDDARFTVTVGVNEYLVNNEMVPLESAPVNQNGSVYVPVSFFTQVLGATYTVNEDGSYTIK